MTDFLFLHKAPLWYREQGPESDVVVSSRVRLARNLSSLVYPRSLQEEGQKSVRLRFEEALTALGLRERFLRFDFEELTETEAAYLSEEGRGERGSLGVKISVFCREDGRLNIVLNDEDHLRIAAIRGGQCPSAVYAEADDLDSRLETVLDYAVSLEWGYLSSNLRDLGSGLGASVLLHLPGIILGNQFERIEKLAQSSGHVLLPYFPILESKDKGKETLGDLFTLKGSAEFGVSEKEYLEKLEEISNSLLNYEREMRSLLFEKKKDFLEDQIYRALGILERARSLYFEEAVKLLSLLRMGCSLGYVSEVDRGLVTSLMFLSLPGHVKMRLREKDQDVNEDSENRERAAFIGSQLGSAGKTGEAERV